MSKAKKRSGADPATGNKFSEGMFDPKSLEPVAEYIKSLRIAEINGASVVRRDDDGKIDDVLVDLGGGATVRIERMSASSWWIYVVRPDGKGIHFNLGATRAPVELTVQEDETIPEPPKKTSPAKRRKTK